MYQTTFLTKKAVRKPFKGLIWGFLVAITLIFGLAFDIWAFGEGWSDNFDGYENNSSLNGQGGWTTTTDIKITTDGYYTAPHGIKRNAIEPYATNASDNVDEGILTFRFYDSSSANGFGLYLTTNTGSSTGFVFYEYKDGGQMKVYYDNGFTKVYNTGLAYNSWHTAQIEFNSTTDVVRFKIDDLEWSEYFTLLTGESSEPVGGVSPRWGYGSDLYFDDFSISGLEPPEESVWGESPESGTEITDLDTTLTVGYEGFIDYDSLYITLRHPQTGIFTDAKQYEFSEIGESGELEINLQDFNIEKNGNWYLHAVATYEGYQYEGGLFLSGYGWNWTGDLTDGEYYLDINIEGYEDIFAMSDFNSWYSENSKFDEPTDMFNAIAGFFEPIFSKLGEFGNRIQTYFDVNSAYQKGFEIGKAIPLFNYYVGQITLFMGGFPLMNWLLIIILLLVGIFIFRVILKFIPFLG